MFKKRNIAKSNVVVGKEDLNDNQSDSGDEVTIQKKKKMLYTSQNKQTDEIKKQVDEQFEGLQYHATDDLIGGKCDNALAENEIDTEKDKDAKTLALQAIELSKLAKEGKIDTKYYRGQKGYTQFTEKSESQISNSKFTGTLGPIRAPSNVRVTCRFDFHPSLCKDYHDTGYCVFGDSCIYLHDRGDYKTGWELEEQWEKEQKKKIQNRKKEVDSEEEEFLDELKQAEVPKICKICNETFKQPVITNCGHYFCEKCAIQQYNKSKTCMECNRITNGQFNDACKELNQLKIKRISLIDRFNLLRITQKKKLFIDEDEDDNDDNDKQAQDKFQIDGIVNDNNNDQHKEKILEQQELQAARHSLKRVREQKNNNGFQKSESDWII